MCDVSGVDAVWFHAGGCEEGRHRMAGGRRRRPGRSPRNSTCPPATGPATTGGPRTPPAGRTAPAGRRSPSPKSLGWFWGRESMSYSRACAHTHARALTHYGAVKHSAAQFDQEGCSLPPQPSQSQGGQDSLFFHMAHCLKKRGENRSEN